MWLARILYPAFSSDAQHLPSQILSCGSIKSHPWCLQVLYHCTETSEKSRPTCLSSTDDSDSQLLNFYFEACSFTVRVLLAVSNHWLECLRSYIAWKVCSSHTKCYLHSLSNMRSNYSLSGPTSKLSFSYIAKSERSVESALQGKSFALHFGFFWTGSEINFCNAIYYPPLI